jgi:hypothetical protein
MPEHYLTLVYCLANPDHALPLIGNPHCVQSSWEDALTNPPRRPPVSKEGATSDPASQLTTLQGIANQQLCTIKALIAGCEKYGLAETTPIVRQMGAMEQEIAELKSKVLRLEKDAALGKVAMRFVDRAGDVHPGIDDADTICAEFYTAMSAECVRQFPMPRPVRSAENALDHASVPRPRGSKRSRPSGTE